MLIVTTTSIESMCTIVLRRIIPSESEIAVAISSTVTSPEAWVAISAAAHVRGTTALFAGAIAWMTSTAMQACSANCARLNMNLTAGSLRSSSSTSPLPSRHPRTTPSALQKINPKTSGMSPSENEWAPRRKCRCTTQRSASAKAIATSHQGRWGRATGCSPATGPA